MPASYALGETFETFIEEMVRSGRYNTKSEVVRDALRLLQDREHRRAAAHEEIRRLLQEGMDSGPGVPVDEVLLAVRKAIGRKRA